MRVATFNLQNLRLRRGEGGEARLDGARDGDAGGPDDDPLAAEDRRLTAAVLAEADADVVALQEVFDRATLDHFHDALLVPAGARPYPHRVCLPGNDGRGQDVALLSRREPREVRSHAEATPRSLGLAATAEVGPDARIFRRDCLEVRFAALTLFVVHFKAPWPDAGTAWRVRRLEAEAVRRLVERRFPRTAEALWMILGDLNERLDAARTGERAAAPLLGGFSVDLMRRLPEGERWSYRLEDGGRYARPDALLASPALARRRPAATPRVLRLGMGREAARHAGPRLPGVGRGRPHASDHAALVVDLPDL